MKSKKPWEWRLYEGKVGDFDERGGDGFLVQKSFAGYWWNTWDKLRQRWCAAHFLLLLRVEMTIIFWRNCLGFSISQWWVSKEIVWGLCCCTNSFWLTIWSPLHYAWDMHFAQFELSTLMEALMLDEWYLWTNVILNWQAIRCRCESAGNLNT